MRIKKILLFCVMGFLVGCDNGADDVVQTPDGNAQTPDEGKTVDLLYDSKVRPSITSSTELTGVNGADYTFVINHDKNQYEGFLLRCQNSKISYASDEDGDGLPDLILIDTQEGVKSWKIQWILDGKAPQINVVEFKASSSD